MVVVDFKLKGIINDKPGLGLNGNFITVFILKFSAHGSHDVFGRNEA